MVDLELLRRLASVSASEDEIDSSRAVRDWEEQPSFEKARTKSNLQELSNADVAALISQEARDAVIGFEVVGQEVYRKRYERATVPGGASGITVGIGYDLGYNSREQIRSDFADLLSRGEVETLVRASGLRGASAHARKTEFSDVKVPWEAAIAVFQRSTMPRFGRMVLETFPNAADLHEHSFGSLFSLVYNRGTALDGPRRAEMLSIRDVMARSEFEAVPEQIRAMERLWQNNPSMRGLLVRRDAEAILFHRGLESARNTAGGALESLHDASADDVTTLDGLSYEVGLMHESAQRQGFESVHGDLESLSAIHLAVGVPKLKSMGMTLIGQMERQLQATVCGGGTIGGLIDRDDIRRRIDDAAKLGAVALKTALIGVLGATGAWLLPPTTIDRLVSWIIAKIIAGPGQQAGNLALAQIDGGVTWVCQRWSDRLSNSPSSDASSPVDPTRQKPPPIPTSDETAQQVPLGQAAMEGPGLAPVATMRTNPTMPVPASVRAAAVTRDPVKFASVPAKAVEAMQVVEAGTARRRELLFMLESAARSGPQPDVASVRHSIRELRDHLTATGVSLSVEENGRLLNVICNSRLMDHDLGSAGDPYGLMGEVEAAANKRPIDRMALADSIRQLHELLGDARVKLDAAAVKSTLAALRSAKLFDELSVLADRFLTREPELQGVISPYYAQALIDTGRIIGGIGVANAALERGGLAGADVDELNGLIGRGHKQIYVSHVRTPNDAAALADELGSQLVAAIESYRRSYDPDRPTDNSYQGVNYIALLKRAERDRIRVTGHPKAEDLARRLIEVLSPAVEGFNAKPWLRATIGEAYLVIGEIDKAAESFGAYARAPGVDAFALSGTVRQLEEVWQIEANATGVGAILTGLKSALVGAQSGRVVLNTNERVAIAPAESATYQEHFESTTEGGRYVNFQVLKLIVQRAGAVAAVQELKGNARQTIGTGFLIRGAALSDALDEDKSYILTNAHVIWDAELGGGEERGALRPSAARIAFESVRGGASDVYACKRVVWQSPSSVHDAALIELAEPVKGIEPLELATRDMALAVETGQQGGTRLAVVGHPNGGQLAIGVVGSIEEMQATLVDKGTRGGTGSGDPEYLHYRTPTEPGNSGSPVFEVDGWKVVGLHHAGFDPVRGRSCLGGRPGTNFCNEGIWIESIRVAVKHALKGDARKVRGRWFR